jgi:hypothetical protein
MITYSDLISFSDYFSQMELIIEVMTDTLLSGFNPKNPEEIEKITLVVDLLIKETERVLSCFKSEVEELRNQDIRENLDDVAKKSPHVLRYLGIDPDLFPSGSSGEVSR